MSGPSTCDCCVGITDRTPLVVANRPGLSAIAYRAGTHGDFLASMLAGLTDADRPALGPLSTRDGDDVTIALLDAWAVVCDVLSFYTERLAQESYLRTATERVSVQELARLIGYRLRPGAGAETHLAFAVEAAPTVAAGADPGSAPPVVPPVVTVEAGARVMSIPGPGEQPQTFETITAVDARAAWNAIPASTTVPATVQRDDVDIWLVGASHNLKVGDTLLLVGAEVVSDRWDVRAITAIEPDQAKGVTRVVFDEPLGSRFPEKNPAHRPDVFVMRKRLDVFGHNAPAFENVLPEVRGDATAADWPGPISSATGTVVDAAGSHPDVVKGSWVVLVRPGGYYREAWRVGFVEELSRAAFGVSGKVTRLHLIDGENFDLFRNQTRRTTILGAPERLSLADRPDDSTVAGDTIDVDVDASAFEPGRAVIVRGTTTSGVEQSEVATVVRVDATAGRWRLVLEVPLSQAYVRGSVVVHGNVAAATHGETKTEVLGSGTGRTPFQRFALSHSPLTHLRSTAHASGVVPAIDLTVNDVSWTRVDTLHDRGAHDRAYTARVDEGTTVVGFGDGLRGARLPTGVNNVRARYRIGLGTAGNVGVDALSQLLDRPLGLKGVTNPIAATGGVDPEDLEAARTSAPLPVRTLGRAVSLRDYKDFARAFVGVAKAHATVSTVRGTRTIVVTVALERGEDSGADVLARLDELRAALRSHGDPHVAVTVVDHLEQQFRLALRVACSADRDGVAVVAGVDEALREAFSFQRRSFAQAVHRSDVIAVAHAVPGVVAVDIDRLYRPPLPRLATRLLAQAPGVTPAGTVVPAGLLVLADEPFDWLEAMP